MDQEIYMDRMYHGEDARRDGVADLLAEPAKHSAKPAKY